MILTDEFKNRGLNVVGSHAIPDDIGTTSSSSATSSSFIPHWTLFKSSLAFRTKQKELTKEENRSLRRGGLPEKLLQLVDNVDLSLLLEDVVQPV